jgi:hypothetical protein
MGTKRIEKMLRAHFMQRRFDLSDVAKEGAVKGIRGAG